MEAALEVLSGGTPLYRSGLAAGRAGRAALDLPPHRQAHAGGGQPGRGPARRRRRLVKPVAEELGDAAEVLGVSVQLEAESARLDPADRAEMLDALGLGEGALPRVIRAAYHLLGRRTFLTTGDKESRAWTFRAGAKAPECAGVIHSDLQRGFIRAEVIRWDELLELGSWNKAKEVGPAAGRRQGLRGRRRRHPGDPVQCVSCRGSRHGHHWLVAAGWGGAGRAGGGVDLRRALAGAARDGRGWRGRCCCGRPGRCTPWACNSPLTWPFATENLSSDGRYASGRDGSRGPRCGPGV